MNQIRKRALDLKDAEEEKSKHLPECITKVNKGKRTLLMKELLQRFQYPDINVADCMLEGFPMMDLAGSNDVFGKKHPEDVTHGADPRWFGPMDPTMNRRYPTS